MAIDIGDAAIDRATAASYGTTYVSKGNPANESGTITSVEIWAQTTYDLANCEIATFYVVSGNNLSTRDTHTIGTVTAGSKQTFTGLDLTVVAGDYIGIYYTDGWLERDTSGDGYWSSSGDQIPCTNHTFSSYSSRSLSVYGTSVTIVTTLAPTLVEDGIANLRLELEAKDGLTINPVGWYCDENAAPTTEYEEEGWRAGIGEIDIVLGIYNRYVKTLPTGYATLYVQAWADDSNDNRYTGAILPFDIPQEPEYWVFPPIIFPELPELPEWELPEWEGDWEIPNINHNLGLDLYLDRTYTRKDLEELRQKCINYEKDYIDYCLVLNHNTLLVKNFLQQVYNNGVLGGENEMFSKVFSPQQLTPLYLDPLEPNDFKWIINRFINNNTSNAMGLNHNFDLFTEWLNDYNYTSDGYKANYITPEEKAITNDEPTVKYMKRKVDKLRKEVAVSSREIRHNFNLIKEIIQ